LRKITSEWYIVGFAPKPSGALLTTVRRCACDRNTTTSGIPNRASSIFSMFDSSDAAAAVVRNSTLPDWM
jgi:hypothetical protein